MLLLVVAVAGLVSAGLHCLSVSLLVVVHVVMLMLLVVVVLTAGLVL